MEEGRPSSTAIIAAMWRAAPCFGMMTPRFSRTLWRLALAVWRARPRCGPLSLRSTQPLPSDSPQRAQALFDSLRGGTVVRIRYTEDELSEAIARKVTQYVILGAGLDSFAYRRPDLAAAVRVFEVDHPATQQWKRARLRALHLEPPPTLTFIASDFERQELAEALGMGGYHQEEPAFFSWLGVTLYLTEEAIFETLHQVATMALGSEIVFDYPVAEALLDDESREMMVFLKADMAARGEPWRSSFAPTSLAERLKGLGFTQVWDFGAEEANARYLTGRADGLQLPQGFRLMKARVGGVS